MNITSEDEALLELFENGKRHLTRSIKDFL